MMKKIIVALLVVAAVSGLVYATYGNTSSNITNNSSTQGIQQTQQINNTTDKNTNADTTTTKTVTAISSAEAMKLANNYIKVSTATAGTPSLVKQDNKMVYIVPIIDNGTNVGEIDIDAQTGANLGGAGGSP
jgi:uncharacterized membrane protein YkoI